MELQVLVKGADIESLIQNLRATAEQFEVHATVVKAVGNIAAPVEKKRGRQPKVTETAPVETPATPVEESAPACVTEAAPAQTTTKEEAVTFTQVVKTIEKLVNKQGIPVAVVVLKEFGVAKGGELKENQYAPFVKRAYAVLDNGL